MWKFLEQQSFHLSESEYAQQLDAVAEYLTLWRVAPNVRAGIKSATPRGPGYTGGGGARAVSALCHSSSLHALRHIRRLNPHCVLLWSAAEGPPM